MRFPLRYQSVISLRFAAILVAIIAQMMLHNHLFISLGLWVVALTMLILSTIKSPTPVIPEIRVHPIYPEKIEKFGLVLGSCGIVLSVISFFLFSADIPNSTAWVLHLLSVILAILSLTFFSNPLKKVISTESRWHWIEIAALVVVFLLAILFRFNQLNTMPYGLWFDEADNGLNALQIFSDPENIPVFAASTRLPAHLIYLIAFSIKLFGPSVFSIRLVSALFGVGTVAAAFLTGKELFNRRTGIVLAFFLAVARWDVIWSHIGMHGITVPFFALLSFGLLLRAFRLQRHQDYLFAGLSLGLGLCFYVPFRLFPLIILATLILTWITHPRILRKTWRHLLVFILGAFVISVPVSQFAVFQPDEFWGRTDQVSIFKNRTVEEGLTVALRTTKEHLIMFNYKGDRNGRHNIPSAPMLDTIMAGLFILGIGLSISQLKKPLALILLGWLLFMMTPGIFSLDFESPQTLRAIGSLPAACLFSVLPIHVLLEEQKNIWKRKSNILFFSILALLMIFMGAINYHQYFKRESNSSAAWMEHSTPDTIIAHEMDHYGSDVDYFVSTFYYNTPTLRYLAPDIEDYHRLETHVTFPFLLNSQKDTVFFIDRDRRPVFDQLIKNYPNGIFTEYKTPAGQPALYEVHLTKNDIQSIQGLSARYYLTPERTDAPFRIGSLSSLDIDWTMDYPGPPPFYVEYSGNLFAPRYGIYQFELQSPAEISISLDGETFLHSDEGKVSGSIELPKGLHPIKIDAVGTYGKFNLSWQIPQGERLTISEEYLFQPSVVANGLLGSYYANDSWQEPAVIKQIDPFLHFYFHNPPLPRPYTIEWTGQIKIDHAGEYEFGLESIDASQLYIDENLLVDNQTPNQYQGKPLNLSKGFHSIRIRFSDFTGNTHINFYWTPPGSDRTYVPSEVLFTP